MGRNSRTTVEIVDHDSTMISIREYITLIEIDENFILRYIFSREYSAKLHLYSKYICCKKEKYIVKMARIKLK